MSQHLDTSLTFSEEQLLVGMIGKRFDKFSCGPFHFVPVVHGTLDLYVDGTQYELSNYERVCENYFGYRDGVPELRLNRIDKSEDHTYVMPNAKREDRPVKDAICDILVYQEVETMTKSGKFFFDHHYTRAIVFRFDGYQIVFEGGAGFSELITVLRGANAETEIGPPEEYLDESPDYEETVTREVISLKEKYGLA